MGEFGAARMREYTRLARENGWRRTAEERMVSADASVATILLRPERANFLDLLQPPGWNSILDLGAGMGAISLALAKSFGRVYALDQAFERLAFLQVVAEQEDARSIRTVCHRDVLHLPFRSGTLQAAVMIGVFEYFPASYPDRSISSVQLGSLAELHRVLGAGGVLFIATKNRFGWPYWRGASDNSGLRFGSLLPRPVANAASLATLHRPYRIVTDSYWRYRSLLTRSGFSDIRFFWPVGGYQAPQSWIALDDRERLKREIDAYPAGPLKGCALSALAGVGLLPFAVPHLGIVARKAG